MIHAAKDIKITASIFSQISHDDNLDLSELLIGFVQIANCICPDASIYLPANFPRWHPV